MSPVDLRHGECLEVLRGMADNSVDSIVTDPPYGLGFMGKHWDHGVPGPDFWREMLRVLKPGGHLLSFGGSRTYHRMACAIEDAGFEVRDCIMWIYGSGFPKSLDVSKAIDKAADYKLQAAHRRVYVQAVQEAGLTLPGNSRHDWTIGEHAPGDRWWAEFEAWLPGLSEEQRDSIDRIVIGRGFKPRPTYQTGEIGGNATANEYDITAPASATARQWEGWGTALKPAHEPIVVARKPLSGTVAANVLVHGTGALNIDGCRIEGGERPWREANRNEASDEARKAYGKGLAGSKAVEDTTLGRWPANVIHDGLPEEWARYFYCAKASKRDRDDGNNHPTVKPTELMRWLCRLVTPPGGVVLDPFMGSGSTGKAARLEGFRFIGIEREAEYFAIATARLSFACSGAKNATDAQLEMPFVEAIA